MAASRASASTAVRCRAARPAALDAKAVALADDMHVRKMRDAQDARAWARGVVERLEIERLSAAASAMPQTSAATAR